MDVRGHAAGAEAAPAGGAATTETAPSHPGCDMTYTWSQYEKVTTCACKGCSFTKQGTVFVSRCEDGCHCTEKTSTKCIPGFFGIVDRKFVLPDGTSPLKTWESAASYFQNNMCVVRGGHPFEMCAKMKCEAFGGDDCGESGEASGSSQSWLNKMPGNSSFEPDPAYCRILDVLKDAHFAHKYGIGSVKGEAFDALDAASTNPEIQEAIDTEHSILSENAILSGGDQAAKSAKEAGAEGDGGCERPGRSDE